MKGRIITEGAGRDAGESVNPKALKAIEELGLGWQTGYLHGGWKKDTH